ncbi:class I SAM-dependent methyltransferase [Bosea sp. (in: a-proteobacteria)]|uniref:class I SAM-dependent methyltransferase n=2 Tax=Pseudomonadota TaxID=1224 RepID=UPI002B49C180|nr:class I SAM-dependent methyltransferase [Bosea sp. (in: a-proteobacteria)]WRH57215.1 MAG: class I SAM-dependent methyltransferase [Bosea sp. (in: a-proteobacteria)]
MTSWTSGYVSDLPYTHGFYREIVPALLSFAGLASGHEAAKPPLPLRYCELGCGQGFSANLIAAANPAVEIHATDFNPAQIAGARRLAEEAGVANVHFYEAAFANFATEPSLPAQFDIIALHGIYSWISPENRRHIVSFIKQKLRPGGLVYVSYNTLPGWASVMPLRRLMVDHAGLRKGPIAPRVSEALAFAESLKAAGAAYFTHNSAIAGRLDKMKGLPREYLAHEYFNADWTPFYFADVAAELAEAKLSFVGSAHLLDQIDAVNLTGEQQTLLAAIEDPVRRQGLRDFMVNQQFRRDIFVKGALPLSTPEAQALWSEQRFALATARVDVPLKATGALGEANLQAEVYAPILDALAAGPVTFRQLTASKPIADLGWARITQALTILVGTGHLQPCLPAADEAKRAQRTRAFNTAVIKRADHSADLQFLASPVTGGGVSVDRIQQLFLSGMVLKGVDPVEHAWARLSAQGQSLLKDGQPLHGAEANLAELRLRLEAFNETRVPVLKQLGVI